MTEDQQKGVSKLLDRLGSALLGLKSAVEKAHQASDDAHKALLSQGNAHLTQLALLEKSISEARKDVENAEDAVTDLRRDLTPLRVPTHRREEHSERPESIELGPVKMSVKLGERLGRALPWITFGFLVAVIAIAAALWLSGARVQVKDEQPASATYPRSGDQP